MRIRHDQLVAMSQVTEGVIEDRIVRFLQENFHDAKAIPKEELILGIRSQIERSSLYKLATERHIATYVVTAWLLGELFDVEFAAIQEVLTDERLDPDKKAQFLRRFTEGLISHLRGI